MDLHIKDVLGFGAIYSETTTCIDVYVGSTYAVDMSP